MNEFYNDSETMLAQFEPKTPCAVMETRPCVQLAREGGETVAVVYPVQRCKLICARYNVSAEVDYE